MSDTSEKFRIQLSKLQKNPIKAMEECKENFSQVIATHTEKLYESIGFMAAFVELLSNNKPAMDEFGKHGFWADGKRTISKKNLAIMAARFLLGAVEAKGALYEQARSYAKVIDSLLVKGVKPAQIPGLLKRETIYGILDQLAKNGAKKPGSLPARKISAEEDISITSDDSDSEESEDNESDADLNSDKDEDNSDSDDSVDPSLATKRIHEGSRWDDFIRCAKEISRQGRMPVIISLDQRDWSNLVRYLKEGKVKLVCVGSSDGDDWVQVICEGVGRSKT